MPSLDFIINNISCYNAMFKYYPETMGYSLFDVNKLGSRMGNGIKDAWAEEEPDTNIRRAWKMRIIMDSRGI